MDTRKIFLASSSELKDDRQAFEIFIGRKNNDWVKRGVHLELVIWEDFLDALSRTRLQDEYNRAIRDCELFVMLFCTKVGKYTAEEFETAFGQFHATGKPFIYTYFKEAQVSTGSANREDLQSLWAFQDKLKGLGHFQTPYQNTEGLLLHFGQQLDKLAGQGFIEFDQGQAVPAGGVVIGGNNSGNINSGSQTIIHAGGAYVAGPVQVANGHFIGRDFVQFVTQIAQSGDDAEEAKSVIALYLHALSVDLAGLKLGEIDTFTDKNQRSPLQLADIYVPLDTTLSIPGRASLADWLMPQKNRPPAKRGEMPRPMRPVSALEALAQHRKLILLGAPGSGKSTFGAAVLLALAQAWQGHDAELEKLGDTWQYGALFPIRVILRRFAEQLPPGNAPAQAGELWAFIAKDLDASGFGLSADVMTHVERVARRQGAVVLFDGLDECGDPVRRQRVLAAVQDLIAKAGGNWRFILTARPYAWPDGADPVRGVYALADFQAPQIEHFIRVWYTALVRRGWCSPGEAESKKADLLAAHKRPDLQPLARNPLLLTLMATLHSNRGRLPDDRADLYNESVDLLMLRWNRQIGADKALLDELALPGLKLSDLREVLEELAYQVHEKNVGQEGAADIGEDKLIRAFTPLLQSRDKAAKVGDYIEKRAGLLLGQGEKDGERQFTFPHRTFQEFLAACHLAARDDFAAECARLGRSAPGHWQVVLALAARLAKVERGAGAADELIGGRAITEMTSPLTEKDWACAVLAGQQLLEIGLGAIHTRPRTRAIADRVAAWLAAGLPLTPKQGGLAAKERLQAGDVLARLGDPRFDPARFYLPADDALGFVHIPADPNYRIGTRRADQKRLGAEKNEINDAVTPTPAFYIARYPVTVAQFRAYLEATGGKAEAADALRDPDNRPVRYVDWFEALAYCRWLNQALLTEPALADSQPARWLHQGWRVCLPSELEWEKAARGGRPDAVYPWSGLFDADQANTEESGLDDTSAVGLFPAQGYGLYDMAGNVWQWTRSLWGKDLFKPEFRDPYDAKDGRENLNADREIRKLVRGGSWDTHQAYACCTIRDSYRPNSCSNDLGFRVVLCCSPESL